MTGVGDADPPDRANPPGRTALDYRIATWSGFRARMLESLSTQAVPPDGDADAPRPLAALTTRSTADATVALVDAVAATCDVLTFYQERLVQEAYLGTAVEQRSVTEIAEAVGYQPAPGVSATADLAFTVETGHAAEVTVPAGHPVLSVPVAQDELPVTFETSDGLLAREEWNRLRPRATRARPLRRGDTTLYLAGVATRLAPGDPIVVVGPARAGAAPGTADVSERWDLRTVAAVAPDPDAGHTVVTLDRGLGTASTEPADDAVTVLTFSGSGGLFGGAAPDARFMSPEFLKITPPVIAAGEWVGLELADDPVFKSLGGTTVDLDREHPSVVRGGWVVLLAPGRAELYRVLHAGPAGRAAFSLTGRVTRVRLDSPEHLTFFPRRGTRVLLGSRELPTAEPPDDEPVSGREIPLDAPTATALPVGRAVLVTGTAVDGGTPLVLRAAVAADTRTDRLVLRDELPELVRSSVVVHGNVAAATHGATVVDEVLGSGDAAVAGQRFPLRHRPLTWVPAGAPDGADGAVPALEVRVNGLAWERVGTLFTAGPQDRVYTLHREHDGSTTVVFGDGLRGVRPPTGVENVRARYRFGVGAPGMVAAGQLFLLQTRPPGLAGVTNPAPATGAAEPDDLAEIRRLSPRTVLTLDRLVALQDYEDHAAGFAGVGKARAASLWDGRRGVVLLTVAGANGERLTASHPTTRALAASIAARRDPAHQPVVAEHEERRFRVRLRVLTAADHDDVAVRGAVRQRLAQAFSFGARGFGQPVTAAEVLAVVQGVPGVVAVTLDALVAPDGTASPTGVLPAPLPRWDGTRPTRGVLLLVDEPGSTVDRLDLP